MLNRYQDVFRCLNSHGVRYVVIGGVAVIIHGVPRATLNLDVLIDATEDNAAHLLDALEEAGLGTSTLTTAARILEHEITIFRDRVRLDVQTSTPGLEFDAAWTNRRAVEFAGVRIEVASLPDLIASKRAAGRPIDLQDAAALEALAARAGDA